MLYVTTRNHLETFTVHNVLTQGRAADGGFFVPLHLPVLSRQEINRILGMSFGQCVAEILNLFFSTKLTGWDIDFCIGRYPVRLELLAHRSYIAETWHNPDWQYKRLERNLMELLQAQTDTPGNWVSVAMRMAILAGILGTSDLLRTDTIDIAAVTEDFTSLISAWYLRKMGFPIGNILCCCNENTQLWELICNGQMKTDESTIRTIVPEADVTLPVNLERLIADCGGTSEAKKFADCCENRVLFTASEVLVQKLCRGFYVSVVSTDRTEITIPNVYKTHNYLLTPAASLVYSGLLDYRVKTGNAGTAIILSDKSPAFYADIIAKAMNISVSEAKKIV